MARELQEKEGNNFPYLIISTDMKLAYQLQQEYLKQMAADGGEGAEGEEYEEGEEEEFEDPQAARNKGPGQAYRAEEQKNNGNNIAPNGQPEKKKKKGFGSKIKSILTFHPLIPRRFRKLIQKEEEDRSSQRSKFSQKIMTLARRIRRSWRRRSINQAQRDEPNSPSLAQATHQQTTDLKAPK
jgi:hypothetical protein